MIVFLTVTGGLLLIRKYDGWKERQRIGPICVLQTLVLLALTAGQAVLVKQEATAGEILLIRVTQILTYALLGIFAGCLLLACITDRAFCRVYHFVWWPAWASGAGLILLSEWEHGLCSLTQALPGSVRVFPGFFGRLAGLVCFCILQEVFFAKLYGRADCHAFCACALVEWAFGISFPGFLLHMFTAVALLAAVQAFRGNINSRGNLKEKVAFLPYITVSFWMLCLFQKYFCIFIQKSLHFI